MDEASNKAKQWFNDFKQWSNKHGVGNLLVGAGGFAFGAAVTMQMAGTWMGGGTLSTILAVPIAFTGGLLGAVALPGATNGLWEKITGEPLFPPATEPLVDKTPEREIPQNVVQEAQIDGKDLGNLTPTPVHTAQAGVEEQSIKIG